MDGEFCAVSLGAESLCVSPDWPLTEQRRDLAHNCHAELFHLGAQQGARLGLVKAFQNLLQVVVGALLDAATVRAGSLCRRGRQNSLGRINGYTAAHVKILEILFLWSFWSSRAFSRFLKCFDYRQ